ncbi:hypothetical protein C8D92_106224 [Tamilnaduibacter salinus]|uniref:UPF0125 protein C8D92_106224 n=1 Tax=Tamilnaduibacter salinus TaxID=1484056 RepID=A0A2U1CW24_9GAMM|nr:RnfH family protein [Tamilnaduibacter salinus]PVY75962.1 hypothetical protein C8D92_106224 [Tamilnaduibacter salinus]
MSDEVVRVEVAYATPERQEIVTLEVAAGTTVYTAATQSGLERVFPELDYEQAAMGVFGKVVKRPREQVLRAGDRVEIYRPLKIDPKDARIQRARKKKKG